MISTETEYDLCVHVLKADDLLRERIATHDELGKSVKLYHAENQKLRVAHDALMSYRRKIEDNPGFQQSEKSVSFGCEIIRFQKKKISLDGLVTKTFFKIKNLLIRSKLPLCRFFFL